LKDCGVSIYRGILTGCNDAFIISGEKRKYLIEQDPKSAEIIRPILRGRDIKRYGYSFADMWLIATFPSRRYNIDDFTAIKDYLENFGKDDKAYLKEYGKDCWGKKRLGQTGENGARKKTNNKWFETQDSISYWDDFSKQKIVWAELARTGNAFTFDESKSIALNTCYILTSTNNDISLKYLLALLNSKLILFYMNIISSKFDETGWRWLKQFIDVLPIANNSSYRARIETVVSRILSSKNARISILSEEKELDRLIYQVYNLDNNEIKFLDEYNFIPQEN